MSYYNQPRYWFVTKKTLVANPNLFDLIWPHGMPADEYIGAFYHVSQAHPNSSLLGLILVNCEIKYISGRPELYFPRWSQPTNQQLTAQPHE